MLTVFFFLFGAAIGSFLNVVIYRLPEGKSLVWPGSHCPQCGEKIRWFDNIPILSYIILQGKCRDCGNEISIRYLVVESITAVVYLYAYLHYGISLELLTFLVFTSLLIPISFIDFSTMLIPDSLSISGIIIGLLFSMFRGIIVVSCIGAAIGAIYILIIIHIGKAVYKKDVMGYGDIKLAAMIGAFVGWDSFLLTILFSSLFGSLFGLVQIKRGKSSMKSLIPYGPFLAIGGFITFLFGRWIIVRFFLG
ncbi:prepilin peptidase [candidate division WOR-3 bacterium]|nr:prepilin peptidase [candidate division WOR-3 bacterium]MCK4526933.1 prepilin peptidase [candidate division WOR-3 bacterium]